MIRHAVCAVLADDVLDGVHRPDDDYRMALFPETAQLDARTESYDSVKQYEIEASTGYTRGGIAVRRWRTRSVRGAHLSFEVPMLSGDIRAAGALIYNKTRGRAVFVLDFGRIYQSTDGPFEITLPADLYTLPTP